METIVPRRGQTVVPAAIRAKYNLKDGDQLVWIDDGQTIRVIPVPSDPISALYSRGKGQGLTRKLFEDWRKYRKKDQGRQSICGCHFASQRPGIRTTARRS